MKKLFAILAVLYVAFVMEQPNPALAKKHHPAAKVMAEYVCPACGAVSEVPGKCMGDGHTLIKVGDYYSKADPTYVRTKPGKGPDGKPLVKMTLPKHSAMHSMGGM